MNQPAYWSLDTKIKAREQNLETYRKLTGNSRIPDDRSYWTLCNYQPPYESGTEIVQLEECGFIQKHQFIGVDWDADVIAQNKEWHPEAHWHCGEWVRVIRDADEFEPALVYLDGTQFADRQQTANMVVATMYLCPADTVLLVNMMLSDPRTRTSFDPNVLIRNIHKHVGPSELKKWSETVSNYTYNATSRTNMITYIFHKR